MLGRKRLFLFLPLLFLTTSLNLYADPKLPTPFSDYMVLQRDVEIRIWGWGAPGEPIEVILTGTSRKTTATPGEFAILVGSSSVDIKLQGKYALSSEQEHR